MVFADLKNDFVFRRVFVKHPGSWMSDIVAISIYDVVLCLWPDEEQDAANLLRVPMLSRWNMTERQTLSSPGVPHDVQGMRVEAPQRDRSDRVR